MVMIDSWCWEFAQFDVCAWVSLHPRTEGGAMNVGIEKNRRFKRFLARPAKTGQLMTHS